jgi:hypothetical protein
MSTKNSSVLAQLPELLESFLGSWTSYATVGSFLLYFFGYLALRFQWHALGVTTDLSALDERYFFAGARFLMYLASAVPVMVMICAVFVPPIYLLTWIPLLRRGIDRLLSTWRSQPRFPLTFGILLALVLIQKLMRPCFQFSGILLAPNLPKDFPASWLLHPDEGPLNLLFAFMLAGTLMSAALLYAGGARAEGVDSVKDRALRGILGSLVIVQTLLLPVNYGMLAGNRWLPRLSNSGLPKQLDGREVWYVAEGAEWATFLSREPGSGRRRLLALPKKDIASFEITCNDPILRVIYLNEASPCAGKGE